MCNDSGPAVIFSHWWRMQAGDADSGTPAMDPVVRHLLDVSMQQGQLFQELAHALQTITQDLPNLKHTPLSATDPLLDPVGDTQRLLTKLNVEDDTGILGDL